MKHLLAILLFLSTLPLFGQETGLSNDYKQGVIETLSVLIEDHYIYPEVATQTSEYLHQQFAEGHFDSYEDHQAFADALTETVQHINHDKHMRIMAHKPYEAPKNTLERKAAERMDQINNYRKYNHGFKEAKLLEGNVAYLDLRGFAGIDRAKAVADAYMKLLSQADAVIIDLTNNGGGDPAMVQYLCSYFFDQKLHLNSLEYREDNRVEEYWTLEAVGGKKMPDIPLFVMISERTFSGAEEFAYNMQTQQRATLLGQTSGGGANPGGTRGINEHLAVFIPTGRAINPITQSSWEGVGVIPEIPTTEAETFERALLLAQEAAESRRTNNLETYIRLHTQLNSHLEQYEAGASETNIQNSLEEFVDSGLFGEWDINNLGYEYLRNRNQPQLGRCILAANTVLFPESPNVFDSYAEALKVNGDWKAAVENYQKAVEVATRNQDGNLAFYQEALQKAKTEMQQGE